MITFIQYVQAQANNGGAYSKIGEWLARQKNIPNGSDGRAFHWINEHYDDPTLVGLAFKTFERMKSSVGSGDSVAVDPESYRELFHTYDQLVNAPPLSFAIRDFWQIDGITLIGGLSGHGKTFILLSIVKALLTGAPLWNYFAVEEKAARVLYLIPESAVGPFAHRLKTFGLLKFCAPDDERLLVRTLSLGSTPPLSDPRLLYAAKAAHVILDTAVRFTAANDARVIRE